MAIPLPVKLSKILAQPAPAVDLHAAVGRLTAAHVRLWWNCSSEMPELGPTYSLPEKFRREAVLQKFIDGLINDLSQDLPGEAQRKARMERLTASARVVARDALDIDERQFDGVRSSGLVEAGLAFVRQAQQFDPTLAEEDIYQASRNVMSMNIFQLVMGLPEAATPSIFAYSLLYPYTDNFIDDPKLAPQRKADFNRRMALRLTGERFAPVDEREARIYALVDMIEGEYPPEQYPLVMSSLREVQASQTASLGLAGKASPYEKDVLGLSFEKGGAATLADGYLVTPHLTLAQEQLVFSYGVFTQLMDDQEDLESDLKAGIGTVFSQTAAGWKLDGLTNRLFDLGRHCMRGMREQASPQAEPLLDLFDRGIDLLLIDAAGRIGRYYSPSYLREIETHLPFRFSYLANLRRKLNRKGLTLGRLLSALVD
jgi:hypothetical protein